MNGETYAFFVGGPKDGLEMVIEDPSFERVFALLPPMGYEPESAPRPVVVRALYRRRSYDAPRRCATYEYVGQRA